MLGRKCEVFVGRVKCEVATVKVEVATVKS